MYPTEYLAPQEQARLLKAQAGHGDDEDVEIVAVIKVGGREALHLFHNKNCRGSHSEVKISN